MDLIWIVLAIESITELIVESDLFSWIRTKVGKPLQCGYCLSFWTAMPFAYFMPIILFDARWANVVASILVYQRLANIIHEPINRLVTRQPFIIFNSVERGD